MKLRNTIWHHVTMLAILLLAAVIIGSVYQTKIDDSQSAMQNRVGIVFSLVALTFLHSLMHVDKCRKEAMIFQRHRYELYYGPFTYLLFRIFKVAFQRLFGCIAFFGVVYVLVKVQANWDLTVLNVLVAFCGLLSFTTAAAVFLICILPLSGKVIHLVLFSIFSLNVILAGLFLNLATLPKAFQAISYASIIRLAFESTIIQQLEGKSFGCDTDQPAISFNTSVVRACFTGDMYLEFLGFQHERKWLNMEIITYITLGIIILTYAALFFGRVR